LDTRKWKCEDDGAKGNIWTEERESEGRMVLRGIFWRQERESERRIVLRGIFSHQKTEELKGGMY